MTLHNSLHTGSAAHAVLSAQDARLALGGLLALGGPGPLDVRLGVMAGPSFAVTGTSSTAPWQYSVPAGHFVTSKGSSDGPHLSANDGVYLASTTVPPASNSRYDSIYVMQQDADATISPDGSTAPVIGVVQGTAAASPTIPAVPAGALRIAHALVASTATGGTSGAGVTITQDFVWTTARGGITPTSAAAYGNGLYVGQYIDDPTTGLLNRWNGTAWTPIGNAGTSGVLAGTAPPAGTPLIEKTWYGTLTATNGSGISTITFPGGGFPNGVVSVNVNLAQASGTAQTAYTLQVGACILTAVDVRVAQLVSGSFSFASGVTPSISLLAKGW